MSVQESGETDNEKKFYDWLRERVRSEEAEFDAAHPDFVDSFVSRLHAEKVTDSHESVAPEGERQPLDSGREAWERQAQPVLPKAATGHNFVDALVASLHTPSVAAPEAIVSPVEVARLLRWHRKAQREQAWRALQNDAGRALTLQFAVLSVLVPVSMVALIWLLATDGSVWWRLPLGMFVIAVCPLVIWITKRMASLAALRIWLKPESYADVTVSSQSQSEVFKIVAWEIKERCAEFSRDGLPVEYHRLAQRAADLRARGSQSAVDQEAMRSLAHALRDVVARNEPAFVAHATSTRNLLQEQHTRIQRLDAMFVLAERELRIPKRRLCAQIFGFDPRKYQWDAGRYVNIWQELLDFARETRERESAARILGLVANNLRFVDDLKRTVACQWQLLVNEGQHAAMHAYCSEPSTTGALKAYVRALSDVAEQWLQSSDRGANRKACWELAQFHFEKQRAHSGYNLHALCAALCHTALSRSEHGSSRPNVGDVDHESLHRLSDVLEKLRSARYDHIADEELAALARLRIVVDTAIDRGRAETVESFSNVFDHWLAARVSEEPALIVTHGYSKTVRDVLRSKLTALPASGMLYPTVLILRDGDADDFDTRLMEFELTQDLAPLGVQVTAADERFLREMLKEKPLVLFTLGVECFDPARRVLHPRGIADLLERMKEQTMPKHGSRGLVVFVAESYKCQMDLSAATAFYGAHLDRVNLYPPDLVDIVASDGALPNSPDGILPVDWEAKCAKELKREERPGQRNRR
ncbi:MAG: hypothetical protein ACYTGZ_19100 [Planctomycetota bacterium]|jgi:hypothetical protein